METLEDLHARHWTDDTSMALCLATGLVHCRGTDLGDRISRYVNWWPWGDLSSNGRCFDIGTTMRAAPGCLLVTKDARAGSTDPRSAGNGSLMQLAPAAMQFAPEIAAVRHHARLSSLTTHGPPEAGDCCEVVTELLARALAGACAHVREIAEGGDLDKAVAQVTGSGYCVDSMEAALWCFDRRRAQPVCLSAASGRSDPAARTPPPSARSRRPSRSLPGAPPGTSPGSG